MGVRTNSVIKLSLHLMFSMLLFVSALVLLPTYAYAEPVKETTEVVSNEESIARAEKTINSLQAPL